MFCFSSNSTGGRAWLVVAALSILMPAKAEEIAADYMKVVRAYADAMIQHGRDTYGEARTPLFAAALDRKTLKLPPQVLLEIPGIRKQDRSLTGANPMHDQNLYQVLYALTKATGQRKYAAAADEALKWFFEHCQSPTTGLLAWGEHLGWDFQNEQATPLDIHEFFRPWVLWEKSFQLAPGAVDTFALGLWRHQIADQQTGEFSRHAKYSQHQPGKGHEFTRHGGFYIATWAAAYQRSRNPELLEAIDALVTSFEKRRNPESGAIPSQTSIPELMWPPSNLSLAIDLWDSASGMPEGLAARMRTLALSQADVFLRVKHDLSPQGKGFVKSVFTSTLETGDYREKTQPPRPAWYPFSRTWATGYGMFTDAKMAMLCLLRYQQVENPGYRKLFMAAADRYLQSEPDVSIALYPGAVSEAMATLLGAYRLTGQTKYLTRADSFAQRAVALFFDESALPRASTKHEHYEAITGGDTLVMELLDLWAVKSNVRSPLILKWVER